MPTKDPIPPIRSASEAAIARHVAAKARDEAARARYGNGPGPVDITFGKVGERLAYVITFPEGAALELDLRADGVEGQITVGVDRGDADGAELIRRSSAERDGIGYPEEVGVTRGGAFGLTVRDWRLENHERLFR
jgi:hypothetical protein